MNERVAGESGPRTTPAGVCESDWKGVRMSSAVSGREPVTPLDERAMAGTWRRRDNFSEMYSDTEGARTPAEEMTRRARGDETSR